MKPTELLAALLIIGIVSFPTTLFAQTQNEAEISSSEMHNMLNSDQIPIHRATNTEGSPYLNEEFHDGTLYLKNGHTTKPTPIRYNTHVQGVEYISNGTAYRVDGALIRSFEYTIDEEQYVFSSGYEARQLEKDEFVQVLVDDEVTFLVRHYTNFFQDAPSYGTATQQDRYRSGETYYFNTGEDGLNRIRSLSKRRVMRNINHFEGRVKEFIEDKHTDFSDLDDLEKLFRYYNTLLKENR